MAKAKKICKWCGHSIFFDKDKYIKQGYEKGRADVIDVIIKSLDAQFLMQNNPNSKFVETIVLHRDFIDELEQLKENKNARKER